MIAAAGATAIATSSGALSWSAGVPDENQLIVEGVLATARAAADNFGSRTERTTNGQIALFPCAAKKEDHSCLA
jgi:hypothetical protein